MESTQRKKTKPILVTNRGKVSTRILRPRLNVVKTVVKSTKAKRNSVPTFPYPPIGHAHQEFYISPEYEELNDTVRDESELPDIAVASKKTLKKLLLGMSRDVEMNECVGWDKQELGL